MEMADAHSTSMYVATGLSRSRGSSGNLREVDLNETPSVRTKRLQARLQALIKTGTKIFCQNKVYVVAISNFVHPIS